MNHTTRNKVNLNILVGRSDIKSLKWVFRSYGGVENNICSLGFELGLTGDLCVFVGYFDVISSVTRDLLTLQYFFRTTTYDLTTRILPITNFLFT